MSESALENSQTTSSVTASLWRVRTFINPYRNRLLLGIFAFGVARVFEAMVPVLTAVAINQIAEGDYQVGWPVAGIFVAVVARYLVVTLARFSVRRVGLAVAFDLRQSLYQCLQLQGSEFFAQYSIGDMMTRAVADIALIQRLISWGTILVIILVYAGVVGFSFMLYYSPVLTLLLLPPMPFVFF